MRKYSLLKLCMLLTLLFVAISCGSDQDAQATGPRRAPEAAPMSSELRAAYIAAAQRDAPLRYDVSREAQGRVVGQNPTHGLDLRFAREGVSLTSLMEGSTWSLTTEALGCAGVTFAVPAADPVARGNRVEYRRGALVEAYLNGPLGLEQVYEVAEPPLCSGAKSIELRLGGDVTAELVDDDRDGRGEELVLRSTSGRTKLRYTDLFVRDARGRRVPAWLSLVPGGLRVHFDDAGAVYPLEIDPLVWAEQAKLLADDGAASNYFGDVSSVSGDTAVVGAAYHDGAGSNSGAAYVFSRSGGLWVQEAKLVPDDPEADDRFGVAVAIDGDTIVVGADGDDEKGAGAGAAYVFIRIGGIWIQQTKLLALDGGAGNAFGSAAAISGNTIVVGAGADNDKGSLSGSAYVFVLSGGGWSQEAKLLASDGVSYDEFGEKVSISGDTIVIGVDQDDAGFANSGSAYVFVRTGLTWTQQAHLIPLDGASGDFLGSSVAISGDTAAIGARLDDDKGLDSGSVYVFVRNGSTWTQQAKLLASDGVASAWFGTSVALEGDTLAAGAPGKNAVYVFTRSGAAWSQTVKLVPSDAGNKAMGSSISISGDTLLVGANRDSEKGLNAGAAYIFTFAQVGAPCSAAIECATGFCVDGLCCSSACGGGSDADCQACSVAAGAAQDGTCSVRPSGALCRAAAGPCDTQETCTGASAACPPDKFVAANTVCRLSAGDCDPAEECNGFAASCPADALLPAGAACRAAAGDCDVAESCTGAAADCPADGLSAAGVACRAAASDCDVAESCDGLSVGCPPDALAPPSTECRASAGPCDASELCDGQSAACPEDAFTPAGTPCRGAEDACDVAESCDGQSAACPEDALTPAGTPCRDAKDACDVAESCDGQSAACPADVHAKDGAMCPEGYCQSGACEAEAGGGGAASSGAGGGGGAASSGAGGDGPSDEGSGGHSRGNTGSCACRMGGAAPMSSWDLLLLALAASALGRRRASDRRRW